MFTVKFIGNTKICDFYTGCIKKVNRFEIALNFAKQLLVSSFLYYIASLGTCNVEQDAC